MATKYGGPAFPQSVAVCSDSIVSSGDMRNGEGMTLRDFFAAHALTGILATDESLPAADKVAAWAYEYADAMLKARE